MRAVTARFVARFVVFQMKKRLIRSGKVTHHPAQKGRDERAFISLQAVGGLPVVPVAYYWSWWHCVGWAMGLCAV